MGSSTIRGGNTNSGISRVVKQYLPVFSLNLCGLIAIRVWIQCNLYDRYISTDSGSITILSNLVRVFLIAILVAIVTRYGFSEKAQLRLGYASILLMTLASVLFLINAEAPDRILFYAACICAGCGIVWGGGMWICHYVRLHPGEALLYAFVSLGVSSAFGFFLGLLPEDITYLISMLMPVLSMTMYQRAQRELDKRDLRRDSDGSQDHARIVDTGKDSAYDKEPKSTFIRLIIGIVLFNLALGIARGFPTGESISLPVPFQALHQFTVLFLSLGLIWWALGKRRSIRFSTLWNISVVLIAVGILLLAFSDEALTPLGATLISASNTFAVGLLWFSTYDMARHISTPSYVILGVSWFVHILPREMGRVGIWLLEPSSTKATILIAFVLFVLAVAIAFLLNDSIPKTRPFFSEFRTKGETDLIRDKVVDHLSRREEARGLSDESTEREPGQAAPDDDTTLETNLASLGKRYYLTEREQEVVRFLAQGRSRIAIAQKLYISENTVRTYVKSVYAKLDIHSKQELIDHLEDQRC